MADPRLTGAQREFLTVSDVLNAHAQFGRLDREMVKQAMGRNWPGEWDGIGAGEGIFEPDLRALKEPADG